MRQKVQRRVFPPASSTSGGIAPFTRVVRLAVAFAFCAAVALPAVAGPPGSGVLITNQATARAGDLPLPPSNTVSVAVAAPELSVVQSGTPAAPVRNGLILYTLTASNVGTAEATGAPVSIDGVTVPCVLLVEPIPAQTAFDNIVSVGGATALYHLAGAPADAFVSVPPDDRSQVDAVAFSLPPLPAATSATVAFSVRVSPSASGPIESTASVRYGSGATTVSRQSNPVAVAVSPGGIGLFVEKRGSRTTAEPGESVVYRVAVKNVSGVFLPAVVVSDALPAGFVYQPGSARRDDVPIADPAGGGGPLLEFGPVDLPADGTAAFVYRVRLGAGSLQGDGINRAAARAADGSGSNEAAFRVKVAGGAFTDRGYVIGSVFADCDGDRLRSLDEPGIPGVRIFMEDGSSAVTDGEGRYSFYGVTPTSHVAKVDEATMPAGATLVPQANRNARSGGSRFIDLKTAGIHRADFVASGCAAAVRAEIEARREAWKLAAGAILESASGRMAPDPQPPSPGDRRALPSTGTLGPVAPPAFTGAMPIPVAEGRGPGLLPSPAQAAAPAFDFDRRLPDLGGGLDFVDLSDGDVLPYRQAPVVVKGVSGGVLTLVVNGREVPAERVGRKGGMKDRQVEAWEYVGVELVPGTNELTVVQADPFGNERGRKTIRVTAPGGAAELSIRVAGDGTPADGASAAVVRLTLTDERGTPVTVRTPVTLEASSGAWDAPDLDSAASGVQQFVEGGSAEFRLRAPREAADVIVRASSGTLTAEGRCYFAPALRPLVAAGVVDGMIGLRNLDPGSLAQAREQDGFERELRTFAATHDGGRVHAGGRAAFFLKGKIRGDALLTMAYDSDKETHERLFRDIQPEEFYPVYGDESLRGYDAQSTGRFFVRVDKGRSSLLYGDYTTQGGAEARRLGAYARSLTGYRAHFESKGVTATAFASRDRSRQVVEEIPGRGVSGPYVLSRGDVVGNSEQVELLVRDRNQPSRVLKRTLQQRFADYEIEPLAGRILFKAPVPSVDGNLDPVVIRVVYETDQGGEPFWVAGVDGQSRLHDRIEAGGAFVHDDNPFSRYTLGSANATVRLSDNTYLVGEWAHSDDEAKGKGEAARVEIRRSDPTLSGRAYVEQTGTSFENPSSTIQSGRLEAGIKGRWQASPETGVRIEAIRSEDHSTGTRRDGATVDLERTITRWLRGEVGARYARDTAFSLLPGSDGRALDYASARAKLSAQLPALPKLSAYGEYEQGIGTSGNRAAIGGEYQVAAAGRVYARHEFISSLAGDYSLNGVQRRNTTVVGGDTQYMRDGSVFSEYRIRDGIGGAETETAVGLRNGWPVGDGLRANTTFERVHNNVNAAANATAATGALESIGSERAKASCRLEFRTSDASDDWVHGAGIAYKANRTVTLLGKYTFEYADRKASEDSWRGRIRTGAAWRPADSDALNALGLYEFRTERDGSDAIETGLRSVHILSTHLNWQPARTVALEGHYAGKQVRDGGGRGVMQRLDFRATVDLNDDWDAGIAGGALFGDGSAGCRWLAGAEVGRILAEGIWASVGYNVAGFKDRDLSAGDYTMRGAYLRLRLKFDERIVPGFLSGSADATRTGTGGKP